MNVNINKQGNYGMQMPNGGYNQQQGAYPPSQGGYPPQQGFRGNRGY